MAAGNHADRHHRHAGFAFDFFRERHVVAGRKRNLLARVYLSGGDVHEVATEFFQRLSEDNRFFRRPTAVDPIGRRHAHAERLVGWPNVTHRCEHLERIAHAVGRAAAIFVVALIGERREELVQQIAVADMEFTQFEADAHGTFC